MTQSLPQDIFEESLEYCWMLDKPKGITLYSQLPLRVMKSFAFSHLTNSHQQTKHGGRALTGFVFRKFHLSTLNGSSVGARRKGGVRAWVRRAQVLSPLGNKFWQNNHEYPNITHSPPDSIRRRRRVSACSLMCSCTGAMVQVTIPLLNEHPSSTGSERLDRGTLGR